MLTSGQVLAERYQLGRRIAVGGMGEVWQAVDVRLDRTVAIKVLKPELCGDAEFLHRFRTEARTTASLNHPGIAAVHDYGETAALSDGPEDTAYLVMELVEGEPLASILAREKRLAAERTLDMLEQAGRALQAAHERGLVHRDVKPGNILVTSQGQVKLTDFGIAKAADAAPVTRSGMVMGTAHYIAPEQALGGEATPSSDVYSLAVVGYECMKGHRPFLSDNAVTVAMMHIRDIAPPLPPDVPPGARALIEATLVKDPRRRYYAGGEFANAVASVRSGWPLPTPAGIAAGQQRQAQPPAPNHILSGQSMTAQNMAGQAPTGQGPVGQGGPVGAGPSGQGPAQGQGTAAQALGGQNVGGTGGAQTGIHASGAYQVPVPQAPIMPMSNTQPPGAIPPQAPVPATRKSSGRVGLWVLLAVVLIVVVVIIGIAVTKATSTAEPDVIRGDTRMVEHQSSGFSGNYGTDCAAALHSTMTCGAVPGALQRGRGTTDIVVAAVQRPTQDFGPA